MISSGSHAISMILFNMDCLSESTELLKRYLEPLYEQAGELVEEEENQISLTKYNHLLNDEVASILQNVLDENPLPYALQDFQKLALHALGSLKNVILVSPTGSGKMIVNYLAIPGKPSELKDNPGGHVWNSKLTICI